MPRLRPATAAMQTTLPVATAPPADVEAFLRSGGPGTTVVAYRPRAVVFAQGAPADSVMYLQDGAVKLSVLSRSGQEAVVAMLEPGAFFGESALLGDPARHHAATAMTDATVLVIPAARMLRLVHEQHAFSTRLIAHMLTRNTRLDDDIVDQLFHSSEQRLARALLLLAHHGQAHTTHRVRPQISQQTLADMVGTTRSRVNVFLTKFKALGYIEDGDGLTVNDSLATVILRGQRVGPWAPLAAGLAPSGAGSTTAPGPGRRGGPPPRQRHAEAALRRVRGEPRESTV